MHSTGKSAKTILPKLKYINNMNQSYSLRCSHLFCVRPVILNEIYSFIIIYNSAHKMIKGRSGLHQIYAVFVANFRK